MPPASPKKISIAIVEDDDAIRRCWIDIIDNFSGYRCVGDYRTAEEALSRLPQDQPEFVLMDINLPGMSGIECTRQIKLRLPHIEVLMLTMFGDRDRIFDALQAGASGYLLKRTTPESLEKSLQEAREGGAPMSPQIAQEVLQFFRRNPAPPRESATNGFEKLSAKETEILRLLSSGCQYKGIADRLDITINTVRTHIRHIYDKLHVHSRTEAMVKFLGSPPS